MGRYSEDTVILPREFPLIIAGCRTISDSRVLEAAIEEISGMRWMPNEVVSGGEPNGVDRLGELWARMLEIPVRRFPADWDRHGKAAGPLRNRDMAEYVALHDGRLLAIWDGASRGTKDMIDQARIRKVPTFIWYV